MRIPAVKNVVRRRPVENPTRSLDEIDVDGELSVLLDWLVERGVPGSDELLGALAWGTGLSANYDGKVKAQRALLRAPSSMRRIARDASRWITETIIQPTQQLQRLFGQRYGAAIDTLTAHILNEGVIGRTMREQLMTPGDRTGEQINFMIANQGIVNLVRISETLTVGDTPRITVYNLGTPFVILQTVWNDVS